MALAVVFCGALGFTVMLGVPARLASAWHNNMGVLALGLEPTEGCPCLDKAARWFEGAIRLDRHNARPYLGLGQVYLAKGEAGHAVRAFEEAVEKSGGDPLAYYYLGVALEQAGRDEDAAISMLRAGNSRYPLDRMDFLFGAHDEQRALLVMRAALKAGVDPGQLHLRLGTLYANTGRWEEAGPPLRRALDASPASEMARQKWSEYLAVMQSRTRGS